MFNTASFVCFDFWQFTEVICFCVIKISQLVPHSNYASDLIPSDASITSPPTGLHNHASAPESVSFDALVTSSNASYPTC